jgi:hypothetical protein
MHWEKKCPLSFANMNNSMVNKTVIDEALELLDLHFDSFYAAEPFATRTGHPVPMDTRGWSQVLASVLSGINGLERKKGADLDDGSDVKGANTWKAIDTPRFNGVIKAGTKAATSDKLESLDDMPYLYLVLWDETERQTARCRIWVVRTQLDTVFRKMCKSWYEKRESGEISSKNFQLHPPRGKDGNVIRNTCGNLSYPLLFSAERAAGGKYQLVSYAPQVLQDGVCKASL